MARKPAVLPNALRDARQRLAEAAPLLSTYAGVEEVSIEMRFRDAEGKQQPSMRGMTFEPHMHAYFHFSCPMRDCIGGGFDASEELQHALAKRRFGFTGTATCRGNRPRGGQKSTPCNIELNYALAVRTRSAA
jgi:hypothetical protein